MSLGIAPKTGRTYGFDFAFFPAGRLNLNLSRRPRGANVRVLWDEVICASTPADIPRGATQFPLTRHKCGPSGRAMTQKETSLTGDFQTHRVR